MKQQAAVDYLIEQLWAPCMGIPSHIIEQAKQMEKEQMKDAFFVGGQQGYLSCEGKPFKTFEQYYDSTNHPRDTESI